MVCVVCVSLLIAGQMTDGPMTDDYSQIKTLPRIKLNDHIFFSRLTIAWQSEVIMFLW